MEILSRWRLKSINSDVPLYDANSRTYGIIVGGELVDVPEEVFLKLFERIEMPYDLSGTAIRIPPQEQAPAAMLSPMERFRASVSEQTLKRLAERGPEEGMKATIGFFKNLGMTKEDVMDTLGVATNDYPPEIIAILGREIDLMYDEA